MLLKSTMMASAIVMTLGLAGPALAGPTWDGIKAEVYAGKTVLDGTGIIALKAPYRPEDVRSVPLSADVHFKDGRHIKSVTFIVDENPSPVAAKFKLGQVRDRVAITTQIRLNQQSDVRIIAEADDGKLYMVEQLVKFAGGQASCSAPPMGDPAEIAANMGKMNFAPVGEVATQSKSLQKAKFELSHPNHTGMVLDQITLLYVPLLMVDKIEARQGDEVVFDMEGSITLGQNPKVEFDYITNGAEEMTMTARDSSGTMWEKKFPIGPAG
jgi:sulfur-oxidizing protein SoxY